MPSLSLPEEEAEAKQGSSPTSQRDNEQREPQENEEDREEGYCGGGYRGGTRGQRGTGGRWEGPESGGEGRADRGRRGGGGCLLLLLLADGIDVAHSLRASETLHLKGERQSNKEKEERETNREKAKSGTKRKTELAGVSTRVKESEKDREQTKRIHQEARMRSCWFIPSLLLCRPFRRIPVLVPSLQRIAHWMRSEDCPRACWDERPSSLQTAK